MTKFYCRKFEMQEENTEKREICPKAPQPLTDENFEEILIRKYFDSMSNDQFIKVFHCEPTDENIERILEDDKNFPPQFLTVVKKSMMETYKVIQNLALDGKSEVAWSMIESLAAFSPEELQYIHYKEGNQPDLTKYIRLRFSQIDHMSRTLDFIRKVEDANEISGSSANISMEKAEEIYNKLRSYECNLDEEQKSSVYYRASELYRRAQIVPGIYHEPKPCSKEILCLRMVLEHTASPSRVDCCLDRMSQDKKILKDNIPLLISAYKRVLKNHHVIYPEDNYRLNSQIAELYKKNINSSCTAFSGLNIQDKGNLLWSEYFYCQAAKKAPNNNKKFDAMMARVDVLKMLGEYEEAQKIEMSAASLLSKPECYEKLLDIAAKERDCAVQIIKYTIRKINHQKMPKAIKDILFDEAMTITKQKTKDPKVISSVERLLPNKKLTPNNRKVRNDSSTYE